MTANNAGDGGERRRLERAPSERYSAADTGPAAGTGPAADTGAAGRRGAARAIVVAVLVADLGGLLFFLVGQLDVGPGLLAIAAFAGWTTALALVWRGRDAAIPQARTRLAAAAFLGGWAVVAGILVDWVYALVQGGVLGPLDYVAQRYGPVGPLAILVAAGVAVLRAR